MKTSRDVGQSPYYSEEDWLQVYVWDAVLSGFR
ncbi:hypothetical protein C8J36_11726 [Rhizobium sp. PP-F2F-G48]|nr:hypothetical protein C8J36_11726 [Rhizobium sp. PP-F2F-G48]